MKHCLILFLLALVIFVLPQEVHAQAAQIDVGNWVSDEFQQAIQGMSGRIISIATRLFWLLATISLVWTGVTLIFRNADFGEWASEVIRFLIVTGLFLWLLNNSVAIASSIINGLSQASAEVGRGGNAGEASSILQMALKFSKTASENMSILDPGKAFGWAMLIIFVIALACYIVVTVTLAMCAATFLVYVGIIVLGFGGGRWTSDIAISYYKSVIAAALKLFALNLLMTTAVNLVNKVFAAPSTQMGQGWLAFATLFIIALLVDRIPSLIGGLISSIGSEGYSFGGGMTSVSNSVVGLAAQAGTAFASGGTSSVASALARVSQNAAKVSHAVKNLSQ